MKADNSMAKLIFLPGLALCAILLLISMAWPGKEAPASAVAPAAYARELRPQVGPRDKGAGMNGYSQDIERLTMMNGDFRHVLYTARQSQVVLMSLKPGEQIGMEAHPADQFFRIEQGSGELVIDGVRTELKPGAGVMVPGGCQHNVSNTGPEPMKLYTIYSPPNHRDGVVQHTRADALADYEHYDGKTTPVKP
jgi:mannose-6-phosphate isomerase-like protein (cupin superfamily)